ncbi:MAG TPA: oligopeptide/dipeptide ABC transporter ATP-binding protein [Solirubrobacteraceae bacterium]|nr:oligopeptide/dipeptide ABC transporter ATP-binding protein [Solirubrobacteraceae bacterium]
MNELRLEEVSVRYSRSDGAHVRAVDAVSLRLSAGRVLGLVGETGCGKSSIGRVAAGIVAPTSGRVLADGRPLEALGRRGRRREDLPLQMVFQDPFASLNPRRRVAAQLGDGLAAAGVRADDRPARARALLARVGLEPDSAGRYPHEFSGGQRQRIAIARVLAARPSIVVADEPISALDASAQAQIAGLLRGLVAEEGVGMMFISHDLSVVRHVADEVAVMYLGRIVERAPVEELWAAPRHPYTRALIGAIPRADGRGVLPDALGGEVPDPAAPPAGCHFRPRCPDAFERCPRRPALAAVSPATEVACFLHHDEVDEPAADGRSMRARHARA